MSLDPTAPAGSDPESALPSVAARVAAFASILGGGLAGALIGHSFATLQCTTSGGCVTSRGIWLLVGAILGALGVAIVAVLTLRALGEWSSIRAGGTPVSDAARARRAARDSRAAQDRRSRR